MSGEFDVSDMIAACARSKIIDKDRYIVNFRGTLLGVDELHGEHEGPVAEIELGDEWEQFEFDPDSSDAK